MQGIILKNGNKFSVKEKSANKILDEGQCVVFIDNDERKIYLWRGRRSGVRDRFSAAQLADMLYKREFGGAGEIIQNEDEIKKRITAAYLEDLPRGKIQETGVFP